MKDILIKELGINREKQRLIQKKIALMKEQLNNIPHEYSKPNEYIDLQDKILIDNVYLDELVKDEERIQAKLHINY